MSEQSTVWDAARVRRLRERLRLTQQQLAAALGVRQQTVSEWETGLYQPRGASRRMLRHVAEAGSRYEVGVDAASATDDVPPAPSHPRAPAGQSAARQHKPV